jgi:hypothetical protein
MEVFTRGNGKTIWLMGLENFNSKKIMSMKVIGKMICNTEKVRKSGQMVPFTRDLLKMEENMVRDI